MRSRKELLYLNIDDLTQEEIEELGNLSLNSCDKCGEIQLSVKLNWIDGEDFWDIKELDEARIKYCALCDICYNFYLDFPAKENCDL